jgi:CO/xanthine dehydrogenase Mo-binding subunit
MTAPVCEKEFSRNSFVKGGGALIVGFSMVGAVVGSGVARAAGAYPIIDPGQLDSWLSIGSDGKVTVRTGRVDQGQGKRTAYAQIVADELDVAFDSITVIMGDSALVPNQGGSTATDGIKTGVKPVRNAAAQARQALLNLAATQLSVPVASLSVSNGVVTGGGKSVTYGQLIGGKRFGITMTVTGGTTNPAGEKLWTTLDVTPTTSLKDPTTYRVVGQSVPRVDIPAKAAGSFMYVNNFALPNMLYGRVVLPPSVGAELVRVKGFKGGKPPGVELVVKNNFIGLVAPREWDAIRAAASLDAEWSESSTVPDLANIYDALRTAPPFVPDRNTIRGNVDTAFTSNAAKVVSARYDFPYDTHGLIGPNAAVASFNNSNGSLAIWSSTQYPPYLRSDAAAMLGISVDNGRIISVEGSSAVGRMSIDDAAGAAALLSQAVGKPVRVQLMRHDEHRWGPHQSGATHDFTGAIDSTGRITAWSDEGWTAPHAFDIQSMLPHLLLGTAKPMATSIYGSAGAPAYDIPNLRIIGHYAQPPIRNLYMRSPGGIQNNFVQESFLDELAATAAIDPIALRINHLSDARRIALLQTVKRLSGWQTRPSPNAGQHGNIMRGRGVSLSPGVANVADVEVHRKTGVVRVTRMSVAVDIGTVVNPDSTMAQIENGTIMGISRGLKEGVRFGKNTVISSDWVTYPIVRFNDVPDTINIELIKPAVNTVPDGGIGEPSNVPGPAAIGNAIFDATGVRMRSIPFTPARVRAALKAAGVK